MSTKFITKCDLCGKEEITDQEFPKHWTSADLKIFNLKSQHLPRVMYFHLCTVCYEPEHSQKDFKQEGGVYINTPSIGAKNIFKKLLTFYK